MAEEVKPMMLQMADATGTFVTIGEVTNLEVHLSKQEPPKDWRCIGDNGPIVFDFVLQCHFCVLCLNPVRSLARHTRRHHRRRVMVRRFFDHARLLVAACKYRRLMELRMRSWN